MVKSQNGWTANDRSLVSSRVVPGTDVRLTVRTGPAGDLLLAVAAAFDARVQDIDTGCGVPDDWAYAERPIRGTTDVLSNHASGTAIDLNATRWPLGSAPSVNLTPAQIAEVRAIVAATGGVVRWGGDYTGRKDPMHFEIAYGATEAECARALAALSSPPPVAAGAELPTLSYGMRDDARVAHLQRFLVDTFPSYAGGLPTTGNYLDQTKAVVAEFQRRAGVTGPDADGSVVGPRTNAALAGFGYRA